MVLGPQKLTKWATRFNKWATITKARNAQIMEKIETRNALIMEKIETRNAQIMEKIETRNAQIMDDLSKSATGTFWVAVTSQNWLRFGKTGKKNSGMG